MQVPLCSDTPRCTCAHLNVGAGLVQGESPTQHQCLRAASLQHSKVADVVSANERLLHVHTPHHWSSSHNRGGTPHTALRHRMVLENT